MDELLKRIMTAARRRPVAALLAGTAVLGVMAGGALALAGGSAEDSTSAEPEIRLDELTPSDVRPPGSEDPPRRTRGVSGRGRARLGGASRSQADAGRAEEPPKRVLRENARIRQELDHLKALAAEQRRVSQALGNAAGTYDAPLRLGAGGLAWPVSGAVVSPFGQRWGRLHAGIDIAAPAGVVVRAAESGRVVISGPVGGYGNYVCVQHTARLSTCYAHLSRFLTRKGAAVEQGEAVGLVGCTGHCYGDHLHFETRVGGRAVDPMPYL